MKIPKTKKILKSEALKSQGRDMKKPNGGIPSTISFRNNIDSYAHINKIKEKLISEYDIKFNNSETIEFALAFTFENYCNPESEE